VTDTPLLTSAVDGDEWSASGSDRFASADGAPVLIE
jgi:hypothetical protein